MNTRSVARLSVAALALLAGLSFAPAARAQLMIAPDSATAASNFSAQYDIIHTINGSGLPAGFDVTSSHNIYLTNNHWTTQSGALQAGNARASFFFNTAQTIYSFNMWNHRSTTSGQGGVGADTGYAVTQFNLVLRDADGNALFSLLNQTALPNIAIAQNYNFAAVEGVRRVDFTILANNGSNQYTGLAEVRFNGTIPAPGALGALSLAGLLAARRRRSN
jgi:hypothetical protein